MAAKSIKGAVEYLRARYSEQRAPSLKGPWEMVLWENIAYLADDDERKKAMLTLKQTVGLQPKQISAASDKALMGVTQHGILPQQFVEKLRQCAQIAVDDFGGDLDTVLDAEPAQSRKILQKFPGIGAPGADKILLFAEKSAVPSIESNGLRVLTRLGFLGEGNYAATYKQAQAVLQKGFGQNVPILQQAYLVLRKHGKVTCRRASPSCEQCPASDMCDYFLNSQRRKRPAAAI